MVFARGDNNRAVVRAEWGGPGHGRGTADGIYASLDGMSLPDADEEYERQARYRDVIGWCTDLLVTLEAKQQELLAKIIQMDETLAKCDKAIDPRVQEDAKKYCMARAKGVRKIMMPGRLLSHMTERKRITSQLTRLHRLLEVLNNKYELFMVLYRSFIDDADNSTFAHELQARVHMMNRVKQDDDAEGGKRWVHLETQLSELHGYIAEANDNKGSVFDQLKELGDTIRSAGNVRSVDMMGADESLVGMGGDATMQPSGRGGGSVSGVVAGGVSDSDFSMIQAIAGFDLGEFGGDAAGAPTPLPDTHSSSTRGTYYRAPSEAMTHSAPVHTSQSAEESLDALLA